MIAIARGVVAARRPRRPLTLQSTRLASSYVVGVDCGTQSTKVCIYDAASGNLVARGSASHEVSSPAPSWAEQDSTRWGSAMFEATKAAFADVEALNKAGEHHIAGVGISFQREGFTLVPPSSWAPPLRPAILWLDGRATAEVAELEAAGEHESYHEVTGKPLDATSSLARMLWLQKHEPGLFSPSAAPRWMDCGAALSVALTGKASTCVAGADTAGLVDLRSRSWSTPLLDRAGLRFEDMPALAEPGAVVGHTTAEAEAASGGCLPVGTPVVMAGGDGQVFATGMIPELFPHANQSGGGTGSGDRDLLLTLGTSVVLSRRMDSPTVGSAFRTLIECDSASQSYRLETVLQSGTYLFRWFVESFAAAAAGGGGGGSDDSSDDSSDGGGDPSPASYKDWDDRASALPPGCDGLLTIPHWWGCRFPDQRPDLRGATIGWQNAHTQAHLYRSLLEGLCFELRRAADALDAADDTPAEGRGRARRVVRVGGGGAASPVLVQILADVLDATVVVPGGGSDAVAYGAAALAGAGAGVPLRAANDENGRTREEVVVKPSSEDAVAAYGRLYQEVYVPAIEALTSISSRQQAILRESSST